MLEEEDDDDDVLVETPSVGTKSKYFVRNATRKSHTLPREYKRFPTDPDLRKLWIEATGRTEWIPTKSSTICSKHFADSDYIKKKSGNRFLNPGASPRKNIESSDIVTQAASTSNTVTQTASTSYLTQAASTVYEITSENKPFVNACKSTPSTPQRDNPMKRPNILQTLLSPTNALLTRKEITLANIISTKESIIKRKRLQIKRIQAQNRRLKRKVNKIEDILNNIQEKFGLKDEDMNTLKNINFQDTTKILVAKVYHYFEQEYKTLKKIFGHLDLTPLSKFGQRTALATGVSETTLLQILKEEEGGNADKRREPPQKRCAVLKRRRQTDSSSEEDSLDDNDEEIEQPNYVDEVQTLVVKVEPLEYINEEPEIFVEVKLEPADGEISKEQNDPISVDVKIEPRDDAVDTTSETLAHNKPAATKRRKMSRKTDDTSTRQHTPGESSAPVASSSVPRTETLNESCLPGEREIKMEVVIHEEGFS